MIRGSAPIFSMIIHYNLENVNWEKIGFWKSWLLKTLWCSWVGVTSNTQMAFLKRIISFWLAMRNFLTILVFGQIQIEMFFTILRCFLGCWLSLYTVATLLVLYVDFKSSGFLVFFFPKISLFVFFFKLYPKTEGLKKAPEVHLQIISHFSLSCLALIMSKGLMEMLFMGLCSNMTMCKCSWIGFSCHA